MLFLDFSKAFDSVDHPLLLYKLKLFGVVGELHAWLQYYLTTRFQRVTVEGATSDSIPVESGVPQGSILGPLFFLLYVNDMPTQTAPVRCLMFADDAKCYNHISSYNDCINLQISLDRLVEWSGVWKLSFNESKCKVMTITRKKNVIFHDYKINGISLERVSEFNDLGVNISSKLSFDSHSVKVFKKCNSLLGLLKRTVGPHANVVVKKRLFIQLVRPHLDYASPIWHPITIGNISLIERIQRSASKFMVNYQDMPYKDRLVFLDLLPLAFRREMLDLNYFRKLLNSDISPPVTFVSHGRTRSTPYTLQIPKCNTKTFRLWYYNRIVNLWNSLPHECHVATGPSQFKTLICKFYRAKMSKFIVDNPRSWVAYGDML